MKRRDKLGSKIKSNHKSIFIHERLLMKFEKKIIIIIFVIRASFFARKACTKTPGGCKNYYVQRLVAMKVGYVVMAI